MIVCVLTQDGDEYKTKNFTKDELKKEFRENFGIDLDFKSFYIQRKLDKILDPAVLRRDHLFRLGANEREVKYREI